jgi:hypothetical protein
MANISFGIPVYQTGIFNHNFIIGIGKQNNGTILETRYSINESDSNSNSSEELEDDNKLLYPPSLLGIANLNPTDITNKFRLIPFFEDMSPKQRFEWLEENATKNNDLYLSDSPIPFEVRIIKLGGPYMIEHYSDVSTEEWFTLKELEEMIPKKPGSKGLRGKSTLVYRPSNWHLYLEKQVEEWKGIYIKLNKGDAELDDDKISLKKLNKNGDKYKIVSFEDGQHGAPNFAIVYDNLRKTGYTWDELYKLAPENFRTDMKKAKELLDGSYGIEPETSDSNQPNYVNYTSSPAFFKSLLQKIIRFRAKECEFFDEKVSAEGTLLAVIGHLLMHPGAFVPNIRRYVSGIESAFKRVAVAICEDAYTEKHSQLLALYCGSALAQREKSWIPESNLIKTLFTLAIEAQQDKRCFKWELGEVIEPEEYDDLAACFMVLTHVKSFLTDIEMVSYIAAHNGKTWKKKFPDTYVDNFQVYAAIDHHTNPEILYFFNFDRWNLSYPEIIKKIWDISSGFNPRKRDFVDSFELKDIREAQKLCSLTKYGISKKASYSLSTESFDFKYTIDKSWLAGLVGPIEIKNCVVVIRVDNLAEFTVIRKPSRDKNVAELTEEEKEEIIDKAKEILAKGVVIKKCPPSLSKFEDAKVKYDSEEEEYTLCLKKKSSNSNEKSAIKYSKNWYDWDDLIELEEEIPFLKMTYENIDLFDNILVALEMSGNGIDEKAFEILDQEMAKLEPQVLRRVSTIIAGMATKITLPKIGRDGVGVDYTVYNFDTLVFQFLCFICNIFPAALELDKLSFIIKNGPLFWKIRDIIEKKLVTNVENSDTDKSQIWKIKKDKRQMWEHQKDIVDTMIERNKEGKRGHLIWLKMGGGKSLIVTEYLRYLVKNNKMPKYAVWTLPSSAIDSIEKEVKKAGFKSKLLDCRKGQDQEMEEGVINIVRHDHLRLNGFDEQIKEKAGNTFFIVDEFHKTMAKGTLRTSLTIDIVKLSYDFIGLSGTIVNKSDKTSIDELIVWLQSIVDFEVTFENYYVAIGALLSRKAETHIVINRELIEVPMDVDYYKLVPPSLGGTANSINFKAALKLSFDAITEELINVTKKYLKEGEKVFVVAKDVENQKYIASKLKKHNIFSITNKDTITLGPDDETDIDVVITTVRQCEGYTLSLLRVMVSGVYFSSLATREQLLGRIDRMNSEHETIDYITVTAGILSYIHEKYEKSRSLHESLKDFAKEIDLDKDELKGLV